MAGTGIRDLRRQRGYPTFLGAATLARVADEMFSVGVVLLVLERTGSAALAGATVAARYLVPRAMLTSANAAEVSSFNSALMQFVAAGAGLALMRGPRPAVSVGDTGATRRRGAP